MSLGSFVHTSLDGMQTSVSFSLDGDNCLVCSTTCVNVLPTADPKSDKPSNSGQVSLESATKKLDNYKLQRPETLSGDSIDDIKAKIVAANPAKPAAEAAAAASSWSTVEDYRAHEQWACTVLGDLAGSPGMRLGVVVLAAAA
eukprot:CAMPEP_0118962566 /NCGR_PEP_ID=MMETSP1173-20130426/859_1 /TAXON_ID=1034831 /ORGANISM="Rhizochromulina marina cf, Strain CCMP1243" /LENGTH=142 /DNA_ID=CAMNT_0006910847 /DNA_START=52 /DNA_END=481 /DNA_ORIENTATION=+